MGKMVLSIIHRESARIWCRENKLISSNSRICHSPMKEVHSSLHPKIGNKDDVLWIKGGQVVVLLGFKTNWNILVQLFFDQNLIFFWIAPNKMGIFCWHKLMLGVKKKVVDTFHLFISPNPISNSVSPKYRWNPHSIVF